MSDKTITLEIEQAEEALDAYGNQIFPGYHSITDSSEYSLESIVSRMFDVCELMTGLGIPIDPDHQFRPSPFTASTERIDYEAAYAITKEPEYWDRLDDDCSFVNVRIKFGEEAVERARGILENSSAMSELLDDYFGLEAVGWYDAEGNITEYLRLLGLADQAYRDAGWEL